MAEMACVRRKRRGGGGREGGREKWFSRCWREKARDAVAEEDTNCDIVPYIKA
jgi:hypothetical protein